MSRQWAHDRYNIKVLADWMKVLSSHMSWLCLWHPLCPHSVPTGRNITLPAHKFLSRLCLFSYGSQMRTGMDTDYDSAVATAISRQEATATSLSHSNQTVQYNYGLYTRVYFAHTVLSCCQMIVHKEGQNVQIQNSTSGSRHVGWQERVKGKISVFLHPNLWVPFFSSNFKLKVFSVCVCVCDILEKGFQTLGK